MILETVHQNHLVEYYPKDETLPPMIEEYDPMDRRHEDFYDNIKEQGNQELTNSEQPGMEDSLPFPIEHLRTAQIPLPQKQVCNTSSDSVVNSPHVQSPAMPVTSDNPQPCLMP